MTTDDLEYTGLTILETLQAARNYNRYLTNLVERAAGGRRLAIDFGAGIGTFATLLKDRGFDVRCVEMDAYLAQRLRADGFPVVTECAALEDESIDYAFSLNVFEHIEDDQSIAADLARKLRPGGRLLIYVPAFAFLWSSLDDCVHHYRRYTTSTLRSLVQSAGLEVLECRYADSLGYVATLAFRLLGNKEGHLKDSAVTIYDRYVMPLSAVLDRLVSKFVGKNAYVICQKS